MTGDYLPADQVRALKEIRRARVILTMGILAIILSVALLIVGVYSANIMQGATSVDGKIPSTQYQTVGKLLLTLAVLQIVFVIIVIGVTFAWLGKYTNVLQKLDQKLGLKPAQA